MPDNVPLDAPGWRYELHTRFSRNLIIIYKDGQPKGQVECDDETDVELWKKAISSLNKKP